MKRFRLILLFIAANGFFLSAQTSQIEQYKEKMKSTTSDSLLARQYNSLAWMMLNAGDTDGSIEAIGNAEKLVQNLPANIKSMNSMKIAGAYSKMVRGLIHKVKNEYAEAQQYYLSAEAIMNEIPDYDGLTRVMDNLATLYITMGRYPKALDYQFKNLALKKKLGNEAGVYRMYIDMGITYFYSEQMDKALEYFTKAYEGAKLYADSATLVLALDNIGNTHLMKGNTDEAIKYYSEGLHIDSLRGDVAVLRHGLMNTAEAVLRKKDVKRARMMLESALELFKDAGDHRALSVCRTNLARILAMEKKYPEAKKLLWIAKANADTAGSAEYLKNCYGTMAEIDSASGDFVSAFAHYKLAIRYRDSLVDDEKLMEMTRKEMNFGFEQKEEAARVEQEKKDLLVREEKAREAIVRNSFIAGSVLFSFLALVSYRSYLGKKKSNTIITKQKEEVSRQNELLEIKNNIIEDKQKEILDSISYAKRIQFALLAHDDLVKKYLPDSFIFFRPKDIVSGDFYWASAVEGKSERFYIAVCDSTGHGVPGAFMSLLNITFLNEAINEKGIEKPNEVLDFVRQRLIDNISREGQKDGFDGILLCIETDSGKISYAAANNAPLLISGDQSVDLKKDRMPAGKGEKSEPFSLFEIPAKRGDYVYLFTDGYPDQFGGEKGKKYKSSQLNQLLQKNSAKPLAEQKQIVEEEFLTWKGEMEQTDDVCVIGFRI